MIDGLDSHLIRPSYKSVPHLCEHARLERLLLCLWRSYLSTATLEAALWILLVRLHPGHAAGRGQAPETGGCRSHTSVAEPCHPAGYTTCLCDRIRIDLRILVLHLVNAHTEVHSGSFKFSGDNAQIETSLRRGDREMRLNADGRWGPCSWFCLQPVSALAEVSVQQLVGA